MEPSSLVGLKTMKESSMTEQQIAYFREIFQGIINSHQSSQVLELVENKGGDEVDLWQAEKERALKLKLNQRNATYLKKVREAIIRIEENTFGECSDCGADIGWNRLRARPTAELCIHCKEEQERGELQTFKTAEFEKLKVVEFEKIDTHNLDVNKSFNQAIANFDKSKSEGKYAL